MKKAALTGLAALSLVDISAATPADAQGVNPFLGIYVGAHAGYFSDGARFTSDAYTFSPSAGGLGFAPARSDSLDIDDPLFGVHGGVNFRLGPNGIIGLEVDGTYLGGDDVVAIPATVVGSDGVSVQYRSKLEFDWQSSIRGRLGFVAGTTLLFATAGVAFRNVDWSETAVNNCDSCTPITFSHSKGETPVGSIVGAGAEIPVSPSTIFGIDYLYENFGNIGSLPHGVADGQFGKVNNLDVHKVRLRVSVKFGGPPA